MRRRATDNPPPPASMIMQRVIERARTQQEQRQHQQQRHHHHHQQKRQQRPPITRDALARTYFKCSILPSLTMLSSFFNRSLKLRLASLLSTLGWLFECSARTAFRSALTLS